MKKTHLIQKDLATWTNVLRRENAVSPWQHAAYIDTSLGDSFGTVKYRNFATELKRQGFKAVTDRSMTDKIFRLEFCGAFRIVWFLQQGGTGYKWQFYWNFNKLKYIVKELEDVRDGFRRCVTETNTKCRYKSPICRLNHSPCKFDSTIKKYSELTRYLRRESDGIFHNGGLVFVSIPGIENVNAPHRKLLERLHRILADTWKQGVMPGNRRGPQVLKALHLQQLVKQMATDKYARPAARTPEYIAEEIHERDPRLGGELGTKKRAALVKAVRRDLSRKNILP